MSVTGIRNDRYTFYHRSFERRDTKEINIYALDGDDEYILSGKSKNNFKIRFIGGNGIYKVYEQSDEDFMCHDHEHVLDVLKALKKIARNEVMNKEEIEIAKLVVAFNDVGIVKSDKGEMNSEWIIANFLINPVKTRQPDNRYIMCTHLTLDFRPIL